MTVLCLLALPLAAGCATGRNRSDKDFVQARPTACTSTYGAKTVSETNGKNAQPRESGLDWNIGLDL